MNILGEDNGQAGRFFIRKGEYDVAEITYRWMGHSRIVIDHTEVDDSLKGQGVGKMLVDRVVEMAREKGLKIWPVCPYAKALMEKGEEYQDVLWRKEKGEV